jgi:hypothetical protein
MNSMDVLQISSDQRLLSAAELDGPAGGTGKSDNLNLKRTAMGFILKSEGALRYINDDGKDVTVPTGFFPTKTPIMIGLKRVFAATTTIPDTDILLLYCDKR